MKTCALLKVYIIAASSIQNSCDAGLPKERVNENRHTVCNVCRSPFDLPPQDLLIAIIAINSYYSH